MNIDIHPLIQRYGSLEFYKSWLNGQLPKNVDYELYGALSSEAHKPDLAYLEFYFADPSWQEPKHAEKKKALTDFITMWSNKRENREKPGEKEEKDRAQPSEKEAEIDDHSISTSRLWG